LGQGWVERAAGRDCGATGRGARGELVATRGELVATRLRGEGDESGRAGS